MAIIKMAPDIPDADWDHIEEDRYGIGSGEENPNNDGE
jgi:hypothetical protein